MREAPQQGSALIVLHIQIRKQLKLGPPSTEIKAKWYFFFKKNACNNSNLKIMISMRSLAKPPRKRKTIDVKASVSHNTTFQPQTALDSDADKLVSSTLDPAVPAPFYSERQLHSPDNGEVLALLQNSPLCRGGMKRIPHQLLKF